MGTHQINKYWRNNCQGKRAAIFTQDHSGKTNIGGIIAKENEQQSSHKITRGKTNIGGIIAKEFYLMQYSQHEIHMIQGGYGICIDEN